MLPKLNKNTETIIIVAVIIIVFYFLYKGSQAFAGLFDSVKDIFGSGTAAKEAEQAVAAVEEKGDENNPFSPRYLPAMVAKLPKSTPVHYLKAAQKKAFAEKIYKAAGMWSGGLLSGAITGSNPSDIVDVFKQISYKTQVSDLAQYFRTTYGNDMLSYIINGLKENQPTTQAKDNKIVTTIVNRVGKLPAY
jgi:hypothetical protein